MADNAIKKTTIQTITETDKKIKEILDNYEKEANKIFEQYIDGKRKEFLSNGLSESELAKKMITIYAEVEEKKAEEKEKLFEEIQQKFSQSINTTLDNFESFIRRLT